MRLTSIELIDFCQHEHLELDDLQRTNFLSGPIAAGKTNILNALRMMLVGHCCDQDGNAVKPVDLIRTGAQKAVVKATFGADSKTIDATLTIQKTPPQLMLSYEVDGAPARAGNAKDVRDGLLVHLGLDPKHVGPALSPRGYLFDSLEARKNGQSLGTLIVSLGAANPTEKQIGEAAGTFYLDFAKFMVDTRMPLRSFGDLADIGKTAATERTKTKASIDLRKTDIAALGDIAPPTDAKGKPLGLDRMEEVRSAVGKLRVERDGLQREIGAATRGGRTAAEIAADVEATEKELAKAEKAHAAALEAEEKATSKFTDADRAKADLIEKKRDIESKISYAKGALLTLDMELSEYKNGQCPKCTQHIPKPLLLELTKAQTTKKKSTLAEIERWQTEIHQLCADIELGERATSEANSEKFQASEATGKAREVLADCRFRRKRLSEERPAGTVDVADLEQKIAAVDARIAAGTEKLNAMQSLKRKADIEAELEKDQKRLEFLEWLYSECYGKGDKNALRSLFGGDGVQVFEQRCNAILSPFGSELLVLQEKDDTVLQIDGMPIARASDGQMVLIEAAVSLAFADGAIALVDKVCDLDGAVKQIFWAMLRDNQERVGSLLCAGAWSLATDPDFAAVSKKLEPTAFYWIGEKG